MQGIGRVAVTPEKLRGVWFSGIYRHSKIHYGNSCRACRLRCWGVVDAFRMTSCVRQLLVSPVENYHFIAEEPTKFSLHQPPRFNSLAALDFPLSPLHETPRDQVGRTRTTSAPDGDMFKYRARSLFPTYKFGCRLRACQIIHHQTGLWAHF